MAAVVALGMMSGTSCDGIDAALIRTDGTQVLGFGPSHYVAYSAEQRRELLAAADLARSLPTEVLRRPESWPPAMHQAAALVTTLHAAAARALLAKVGRDWRPQILGFHGQTVVHRPAERLTLQLGDGADLALRLNLSVAWDFRSRDVAAGGQGAPLVPLFHQALVGPAPAPVAVLNVGGVANVTYIEGNNILAFDVGPGNALIDDWIAAHGAGHCDLNGNIAAKGRVATDYIKQVLSSPFFERKPPKSLDRNDFSAKLIHNLSLEDGAATLTALTVACVSEAQRHFPQPVGRWVICGGGRHNPVMMAGLRAALMVPVEPAEAMGWDGDMLEAQCFGHLAVRVARHLPLSLPGTTGVPVPMTGGRLSRPF